MLSANSGLRGCWAQCTLKSVVKAWGQRRATWSAQIQEKNKCRLFISMQFWWTAQVINSYLIPPSNTKFFGLSCSLALKCITFESCTVRLITSGRKLCFLVTWYNISWVSIAGRISPFNTWEINNTYKANDTSKGSMRTINDSHHTVLSDLQSREEGQQRVHPGASRKQWFVDVDIQQQRRLADIFHYRCIVLQWTTWDEYKKKQTIFFIQIKFHATHDLAFISMRT